jgi:hypothetical protein
MPAGAFAASGPSDQTVSKRCSRFSTPRRSAGMRLICAHLTLFMWPPAGAFVGNKTVAKIIRATLSCGRACVDHSVRETRCALCERRSRCLDTKMSHRSIRPTVLSLAGLARSVYLQNDDAHVTDARRASIAGSAIDRVATASA